MPSCLLNASVKAKPTAATPPPWLLVDAMILGSGFCAAAGVGVGFGVAIGVGLTTGADVVGFGVKLEAVVVVGGATVGVGVDLAQAPARAIATSVL